MQEHIRRAHPEHYISKLPATEESFALMINTPPSERPHQPSSSLGPTCELPFVPFAHLSMLTFTLLIAYSNDRYYKDESSSPNTPRHIDEYHPGSLLPATSAAVTLAQ